MRIRSLVVRWALAAILCAPAARAAIPGLEWVLSFCASQQGDTLVLANCTGGCPGGIPYFATAATTITTAGTLSLQIDWSVTTSALFEALLVRHDGEYVLIMDSESDFCSTYPCTGSKLLQLAVLPGDTVEISLDNGEEVCIGGITCTIQVSFAPVVGFGPGFGGLDSRLVQTVEGQSFDQLAAAMCFVGDVDGDGLDDLALASIGKYVRLVSGATGATILSIPKPPGVPLSFGGCLAGLGDVNGDGAGDLLVGSGVESDNGPVRVFSGATGQLLFTEWSQVATNEQFGYAVAGGGDIDADGVPDLLVGAPLAGGTGATRAYSGASHALLLDVPGLHDDLAGSGVASVGDVDGDGHADFAAGAPYADAAGPFSGKVRHYSGSNGALIHEWSGPADVDRFGSVVAAGGDLDADGYLDLVASSPSASPVGIIEVGLVRALSPRTGQVLWDAFGTGQHQLGHSLAAAGDWDGDGHDDALAGSYFQPTEVRVLSGATGETLVKLQLDLPYLYFGSFGAHVSDFGYACAGAGDANGDGRPDFAVGAPAYEDKADGTTPIYVGKAFLYSGNSADYVPPPITGSGSLLPGSPFTLGFGGGDPFAPAFLVVGASAQVASFKTGVLVPAVDLLVPLVLDGSGTLTLASVWPVGIPSGVPIWLQSWLPDSDGFAGWFASDSLTIVSP